MYDIIGDIHGHAGELRALLAELGYSDRGGRFAHSTRKVIFVGDFVDRGPQIADVLRIVRSMVNEGDALAVMGNHEFNAIAFHTSDPEKPEEFLRPHMEKNRNQHAATLAQLTAAELGKAVRWFQTLPMSLELNGVRVIHACWDPSSIALVKNAAAEHGGFSTSFMQAAMDRSSRLFDAFEIMLKGRELSLPDGVVFKDKDGHQRSHVRIRWFESPQNRTYREYALPAAEETPDTAIPESAVETVHAYDPADCPVFFGHYWLSSKRPERLARNVACVDSSVARGGSLCCYRWDG
ncbi:MAG: metallophosphoesterase [Planctomycetaceae bacterium]|nr:metallophosphoesterase [Planctomycetaceae bacterium]